MPPKSRKKPLDAFIETVIDPPPVHSEVEAVPQNIENSSNTCDIPTTPPKTSALEAPLPPAPKKSRTRVSKKEDKPNEHVIVQLPIPAERIDQIIEHTMYTNGTATASYVEPLPFTSTDHFTDVQDTISDIGTSMESKQIETAMKDMHPSLATRKACFWCCHEIGPYKYGMPISFDPIHRTFHQFGTFCSLECAAAHNFSVHTGSDRMWEIHSWIQMLAKKLGIELPIRAAPSRFLLQMFGGPMRIEDFRACHKSLSRAYVMNIPPMINVSSQTEIMNVSYIYERPDGDPNDEQRTKLSRKKSIMDTKRTLDSKLNLSYETIPVDATED